MATQGMSNREWSISIGGAFFAMLLASFFSSHILAIDGLPMILASTGASAMLIFGLPHSPVSQPKPLVRGHVISAFIGVTVYYLIPNVIITVSVAIGLAMMAMYLAQDVRVI